MINELPIEPLPFTEEQQHFSDLINHIDRDRFDLRDPIDIIAELEWYLGCPLALS